MTRHWLAMACLLWLAPAQTAHVQAAQKVLFGVPEYGYYYGCAPTCGAVLFGYWDARGYPDLLPGRNWPIRAELRALIASSGHLRDYWVSEGSTSQDPWVTGGWTPHAKDCLADFMCTSYHPNPDAWTNRALVDVGLGMFAQWDNPATPAVNESYSFSAVSRLSLSFQDFVAEIHAGRPVLLFVRVGSSIDHTIVGYGYDDTNPVDLKVAAMDTYLGNAPGTVDWWPWSKTAGGVTLTPVSPPQQFPLGDVDQDGVVNVSDLVEVRTRLGESALIDPLSAAADVDGNGIVNVSDLVLVRTNLGTTLSR